MRIVQLDPGGYTAHYDGNLCHELARRGHAVRLDTSRFLFEDVGPLGGYEVAYSFFRAIDPHGSFARWAAPRQLAKAVSYPVELVRWERAVRASPPDVVHLQWSLVPPLDLRVARRLRARGARIVVTAHELPWGNGVRSRSFTALCRSADAVVVHAAAAVDELADRGVPSGRIRHMPMGGPGLYAGPSLARATARARLGLPADGPLALFFGLVKGYKGLDVLLEALPLARERVPGLRLLVAGRSLDPWGPYAARIERLGLGGAVVVRPDFVPTADVNAVFCAADVVVLPYRRAVQSGVVLAAWQFGRPVVATRVGGVPELVEDGVTGFLARPEDPVDLARALVEAFSDEARLAGIGTEVAARAAGPHSWAAIAERHESVYEEALGAV